VEAPESESVAKAHQLVTRAISARPGGGDWPGDVTCQSGGDAIRVVFIGSVERSDWRGASYRSTVRGATFGPRRGCRGKRRFSAL